MTNLDLNGRVDLRVGNVNVDIVRIANQDVWKKAVPEGATNFRAGQYGGDWVDRGAGAYGYDFSWAYASPSNYRSFPSTMTFSSNSSNYGTWNTGGGTSGIENPTKTARATSYLFAPTGQLTVSLATTVNYRGVVSLFTTQLSGETRVEDLTAQLNGGTIVNLGTMVMGNVSNGGRFFEFDLSLNAGSQVTIGFANGNPNNTTSGIFLGANIA